MTNRFQVTPVANDETNEGSAANALEMQPTSRLRVQVDPALQEPSSNLTISSLPINFSVAAANTQELATNNSDRHSIAAKGTINR